MDEPMCSAQAQAQPSANNYIVSAQKPTVINAAVVGNFRNEQELDMVISKVNRVEHLLVTPEGLKPYREIPIFGRIASLIAFRLPGESLDSILILTVKYDLAILNFKPDGQIRTRASGHVADKVGRPAETGIIACVHASGLIALRLYEGHLKLIQWQDDKDLKCFNVRFEDCNVTDVAFLENTEKPAIAYFYQDQHGKHLKVCELDLEEKELQSPLWKQGNIEAEATLLIPVPAIYGGLIIVGQESISYQKSANQCTSISPPMLHMSSFNCYAKIDKTGERFLLGDVSGRLFMLLLVKDSGKDEIKDLKIELLGVISSPECLVYLDNSVAFVGSRFGDSQLVKLSTEPVDAESNSFVDVIDSYNNLGPIRDMVIINNEGQNQVITCSGAFKDGSLRVIRNGIGIDTLASVELAGVKSLFLLKLNTEHDRYMAVSFAELTHLLLLDGEEMEDTQLPDFDLSQPTLYAGNLSTNRIIQITSDTVRLISGDGLFKVGWQSSSKITLCSVNTYSGQVLLGSGDQVTYLQLAQDTIQVMGQVTYKNQIACLDISPIEDNAVSKVFAVGFWNDQSVALYSLESKMQVVSEEKLTGEVLPRSLLIIAMEGVIYLLVALGDGTVYYFRINPENGCLTEQKKVTLGTQPTLLKKFVTKGVTNVFACSDRPTVIYSSSQKLAFSNVNLKMVNQVAQLNSDYYKDSLVMSDGENLIIGTIDDIQKLHIRTIPLFECASRIAYQPETNTIAVLTSRIAYVMADGQRSCRESVSTMCTSKTAQTQVDKSNAPRNSGCYEEMEQSEVEVYSLCVLDANSFECLYVYELAKMEIGISLCTALLADDPQPYFAVGTSLVHGEDTESKQGRILIFQVQNNTHSTETGRLRLVTEKEVKGAVYSMTTLSNKLICCINTSVRLFEWTVEKELRLECSHFNFITALYVKTKGDLVLAADLMKSICLLSYKAIDSSFEEIARDYASEWMTACEIIDSDTFLGGENYFNIFCAQKDVNAETDEERMRLKQVGLFYLGEMINVFRRGTILANQPDQSTPPICSNPVLFGTGDGGLGVIVQLPDNIFAFLQELQKRIAASTHNCMRVEHCAYRAFYTERRSEQSRGFIDGDLVETIADMPRDKIKEIIEGLKMPADSSKPSQQRQLATVGDVLKMVEDLSRIH